MTSDDEDEDDDEDDDEDSEESLEGLSNKHYNLIDENDKFWKIFAVIILFSILISECINVVIWSIM